MSKWHKVGNVQSRKDNNGFYITLGNPKGKYKPFSVKVQVFDTNGDLITEATDPIVNIQDPRNNPNLKEGQAEKIPSWLVNELFIVERE